MIALLSRCDLSSLQCRETTKDLENSLSQYLKIKMPPWRLNLYEVKTVSKTKNSNKRKCAHEIHFTYFYFSLSRLLYDSQLSLHFISEFLY